MKTKGFVVRGQWRDGRYVYAYWWSAIGDVQWTADRDVVPKDAALLFAALGEAIGALLKSSHLTDVRILAVAEDGTETPLPTYQEALAEIAAATAERDEARAWVRRLTSAERVLTCAFCGEAYPPGTPESNDDALTAHVRVCPKHPMREVERERDAERKAWARLVVAASVQAVEQRPDTLAEYDAARRALQAFEIDVDALAKEAIGR